MLKFLSVLSIVLVASSYADGQSFYAARRERSLILVGGIGTSSYLGDLKNDKDYLDAKPTVNVGLQYYLNNRFSVRAEATWFQLKGDDKKAPLESGRQTRNLNFESNNFEFNATGHVSLLPMGKRFYQRPGFNLYAFAGVGGLYFNPTTTYQGQKYALQPLQTELVKYSRFTIVIPMGLGVKFKVGPLFNVALEGGYRKTFTDYIDDVSTTHKGPAAFTNPIAAALSDRRPELTPAQSPAEPGYKRGDPSNKDAYFLLTAKIEYYLPIEIGGPNNQRKLYKSRRKYGKPGGNMRRRR